MLDGKGYDSISWNLNIPDVSHGAYKRLERKVLCGSVPTQLTLPVLYSSALNSVRYHPKGYTTVC